MKKKTYSLNKRLKLLVDRKDISVLERDLPAKREFVLTLKMTGFQKHLYRYLVYIYVHVWHCYVYIRLMCGMYVLCMYSIAWDKPVYIFKYISVLTMYSYF